MSKWKSHLEVILEAPEACGTYHIGFKRGSFIDTIYLGKGCGIGGVRKRLKNHFFGNQNGNLCVKQFIQECGEDKIFARWEECESPHSARNIEAIKQEEFRKKNGRLPVCNVRQERPLRRKYPPTRTGVSFGEALAALGIVAGIGFITAGLLSK